MMRRSQDHVGLVRCLSGKTVVLVGAVGLGAISLAPGASAQLESVQPFDIPSQPLNKALRAFASQSGVQIAYRSAVAAGASTPAVRGKMTREAALNRLLGASGLHYSFDGSNTVTIVGGTSATDITGTVADNAIELEAIDVQGRNDGTSGYVAKRSALGTKMDTPLIETPQSVSVVTRKQIEDQNALNVRQALRYTPGVQAEYRGGGGSRYDTIIYRGFGGGVNYDYSYLDGMRLLGTNYAVPQIDPYNLERIEVLRGPTSVLYGAGTPGGLVNLVSKLPTETPFHEVQLQGGSFNQVQGAFDLSGPVDDSGSLLYRLTAVGHTGDTQVKYTKDKRVAISPALTWRPDTDTSITVLGKYQHDPDGGYFGFLPAVGTVTPLPIGGRIPRNFFDGSPNYDKFDRTQGSIGTLVEHRFDDVWSVRSSFRYMHVDLDYKSIYTTGINTTNRNDPLLTRGGIFNLAHLDAITTDNAALAHFHTGPIEHKLLFGIDYQHYDDNERQGSTTEPSLSILHPNYGAAVRVPATTLSTYQTLDQTGFYAQEQARYDHWVFLAGLREDLADITTKNRLGGSTVDQPDHALTWRTGLVYEFDNGFAPYFSYSTSFLPISGTDYAGTAFKPTTGEQYEGGIKYQPPGFDGFFTAAVFDLTQQNVLTTDPTNTNYSIQTGEVHSRGVELEAHANIDTNWSLIGAYSYVDLENTKSTTAQGKVPTLVPDQTASLWVDYTQHAGALAGFGIAGGVRYVGKSWGNATNTIRVPDFALLDAAIHYDLGAANVSMKGWRLAVNATNLADKTYVSACATATKCFYGAERTVYGRLSYQW